MLKRLVVSGVGPVMVTAPRKTAAHIGRESGQMLILFVLALGVLLGFVAMSVDVGLILHERRSLQNAADAAALAGAIELPESQTLAGSKAQEWAENNGIDLGAGDEITITVDPVTNAVDVEVTREASFIFGRALGLTTVDVHASATARIGSPSSLAGLVPFGVLEDQVKFDGTLTTLKYDASDPTKGNFGPVKIDGDGARVHRDGVMYGSTSSLCGASQPSCVDPSANTQTGNMVGPTRTGVKYRFNQTTSDCDDFDEVLIPRGDGSYNVNGACNPWAEGSTSQLLVLVPVIDKFPAGTSTSVTVLKFAAFFLESINKCSGSNCEITGTFVSIVADPTTRAELGIFDPEAGIKFVRLVE